jgi:hypothetical protein
MKSVTKQRKQQILATLIALILFIGVVCNERAEEFTPEQ